MSCVIYPEWIVGPWEQVVVEQSHFVVQRHTRECKYCGKEHYRRIYRSTRYREVRSHDDFCSSTCRKLWLEEQHRTVGCLSLLDR